MNLDDRNSRKKIDKLSLLLEERVFSEEYPSASNTEAIEEKRWRTHLQKLGEDAAN